jgi:hypothetical protein
MKQTLLLILFITCSLFSKAQNYVTTYDPATEQCGILWVASCHSTPAFWWVEDSVAYSFFDQWGYYHLDSTHTSQMTSRVIGIDKQGFTFPTDIKRTETYSGTTNASGAYTVTFPTSYSTTPNIQANIVNQSATNQYLRISSISTTGFTVNAYERSGINILGNIVLLSSVSNVSGATIHVLITEN